MPEAQTQPAAQNAGSAIPPLAAPVETKAPVAAAPAEAAKPAPERPSAAALAILREKDTLAKERKAFEQERQALGQKSKVLATLEAAVKSKSPAKALEAAGFEPSFIAEFVANGPTAQGADALIADLKAQLDALKEQSSTFRQELDADKQAALTREQQAQQAEIEEYKTQTLSAIQAQVDKYPFLVGLEQAPAIFSVMKEEHEKSGKFLSPDEAAVEAEKRMATQFPATAKRILKIPAMRAAIMAAMAELDNPEAPAEQGATPQPGEAAPAPGADFKAPPYRVIKRAAPISSALNGKPSAPVADEKLNPAQLWDKLRNA